MANLYNGFVQFRTISMQADIKQDWETALKDCQTAEGASDDDLIPFIKHEMLTTYKSKCILACVNDKLGYVGFVVLELFMCQK